MDLYRFWKTGHGESKKKLSETIVEKRKQTAENYIELAQEHMAIKKAGD